MPTSSLRGGYTNPEETRRMQLDMLKQCVDNNDGPWAFYFEGKPVVRYTGAFKVYTWKYKRRWRIHVLAQNEEDHAGTEWMGSKHEPGFSNARKMQQIIYPVGMFR